jgi:3-phenylpropionate/cinnamic acid dioxygenase small subunit
VSDRLEHQHRLERFLFREARLLDERRFEEWQALFADDGIYWIPATPGQTDPVGEVSIAYENSQLLDVRVRRLMHEENYADQPPARTRRVIGNVTFEDEAPLTVRSNFTLVDFQGDEQRVFAGQYVHDLVPAGDGFRISLKRVNLLNCDAPMGAIVVPF